MKLLVGLGNPGKNYAHTRHNIGFDVIDELAKRWNAPLTETKFNGVYSRVVRPEGKVMLLKPLTYMNLSGECIVPMMDFFEIADEDLIVIYDDLDLDVGRLRLRQKGSAGGHNGIKSIIHHLGSNEFNRIRVGIGRPAPGRKVTDHVLTTFSPDEQLDIRSSIETSADACEMSLSKNFLDVMNQFNSNK
ncbi:aminoacyl-tRNA hydrolase [Paenisporosarcina cavernae]|uniref:Peptidyl-tRNA hydrolase n=1 Tax=Paenisporosarcina cavernae TaxID=2320858 RepID=A0A385YXQ4_9BACL|nr:aminoacyl-tRNA hydrolase [Paenisporosarcina cavernae]AYC30697.1 aminoacyl-tRNA hydrolase [Paenisporosarcina cavernae]